MSKWNKKELENMLEDVVNELDLSEIAVEKHGQEGTAPAELVRLVLEQKNLKIRALEANFVDVRNESVEVCDCNPKQACEVCAKNKGIEWDYLWDAPQT